MNTWDQVLARVETKVNRHSFYTWFKPTSFIAEDGVSISVRVPNTLFKEWLTKHYAGVIAEALGECQGFKPGGAAPVRLLDASIPRVAIVAKSP